MTVTREQLDEAIDAYRDACWDWARLPYRPDLSEHVVQATYDAARRHLHALLDKVLPHA